MELYSLRFVLFLLVSLVAYYGVGRLLKRGQWIVLLASSLVFYCLMGSWQTLVFVVFVALITWGAALLFERFEAQSKVARKACSGAKEKKAVKARFKARKRWVLLVALLACFGVLAYLKYWNVILYQVGLAASARSLGLLLPLGISFYTFQSVGYLIDAYNGKIDAQKNPVKHLLFVTYFPQLIQGPINRYDQLGPQLLERHHLGEVNFGHALITLLYGMLKKFVMADLLVDVITNFLGAAQSSSSGALYVVAILMYSAQQYGDFSGGIDMVEGYSELFGIRMGRNFRRPYFSVSLADFWRRWHISLGQWMRDYVFYPLALTRPMKRFGKWAGGSLGRHAGRTLPACVANIVVFLLVGIWHGAEFHFVAWGLYNGLVIALSDLLHPAFDRLAARLHVRRESGGYGVFAIVRTFIVVNIGWYFDRITDISQSFSGLYLTVANFQLSAVKPAFDALSRNQHLQVYLASVAICVVLIMSICEERSERAAKRQGLTEGKDIQTSVRALALPLRSLIYVVLGLLIACSFIMNVGGGFMYANY